MDANYFGKCKASELRAEIGQARKKGKPNGRVKVVLKKIISNIILNKVELASLMNEVVYLLTLDDYEISRLCSHYIVHYAAYNPEDALNALEIYHRFAQDKDPLLRALSVKTVSSVRQKDFFRQGLIITRPLLDDNNPHVRTAAAFAVARLFHENQVKVVDSGLIEGLNDLLYDENKNVVASALAALDSIIQSSPSHSLNVNKEHLLALIAGIATTSEWKQVSLLDALMSYVPQSSNDALEMMDAVLPCFLHENTAVVLNSVKLVVYLSNFIASPESNFSGLDKRLGSALVSMLSKPPEIQFLVLRNVILILLGRRYLVDVDVELFFWNLDDPMYIKDTKLEIIYLLADEGNYEIVFRELEEYATDVDVKMARKAIRAFGNLSIKLEAAADRCVALLIDLLAGESPRIAQEAIIVMTNILRKYQNTYDDTLDHFVTHYKTMEDDDAKIALSWILGNYSDSITFTSEALKYLCDTYEKESVPVQLAIMTAVVKYYVANPLDAESLVLQVLKYATEESGNPDLRERGLFYWRMITHEYNAEPGPNLQKYTKHVVMERRCQITPDAENIDPSNLEELELNIGTLASIYLKSVRVVFRFAKQKSLPKSPALQERRRSMSSPKKSSKETNRKYELMRLDNVRPTLYSAPRSRSTASITADSLADSVERPSESLKNKFVRRASSMMGKKHT